MATTTKLKESGFTITKPLKEMIKQLPPFEVISIDQTDNYRRAVAFIDHDTDIVIRQKIK